MVSNFQKLRSLEIKKLVFFFMRMLCMVGAHVFFFLVSSEMVAHSSGN